jgi:hypothetical protein
MGNRTEWTDNDCLAVPWSVFGQIGVYSASTGRRCEGRELWGSLPVIYCKVQGNVQVELDRYS